MENNFNNFKTWYDAVMYVQKNKIKDWVVVKVNDHYEIRRKEE